MIELKDNISDFFKEPTDSVIISIVEGTKGRAWTDEENKQAFAFDGIYGYLDGEVTAEFVMKAIKYAWENKTLENITVVPQNESVEVVFLQMLEMCEQIRFEKKVRYLMSEPVNGFDISLLKEYIALLPDNMRIESFSKEYFEMMKNSKELEYLTESYKDYCEFEKAGVGYLITDKGKIVAGAVSYSVFSEGMEIQLMTVPEYRGNGLAGIVVARLLLHCVENQLRAIWDAANLTSVSIAKRMGYELKRKYNSYVICKTNYL